VKAQNSVRERAREFALANVKPFAGSWEREKEFPTATMRAAVAEFGGLALPAKLGGKGAPLTALLEVLEEFAAVDIAFAIAFVVKCNVALVVSCSENCRLRDEVLPGLISGDHFGAFCLTEPQAGSDAAAITTTATREGDRYLINGTKAWVVNGASASRLAIFAKTDVADGTAGIALFLGDDRRAGLRRGVPYELMAGNLAEVGDLWFENYSIGTDEILFGPGDAFKAAMRALDAARIGIAAICNGALAGGLDSSLKYAARRRAFGSSVLEKQGVEWCFADHFTALEASRALTMRAAAAFCAGHADSVLSAHAKKFANLALSNGLSWAIRGMGAAGTLSSQGLARQFSSAQLLFDTDGTPEILNVIIGRELKLRALAAQ